MRDSEVSMTGAGDFRPEDVLAFWFPDNGFWESQEQFSRWVYERMQGGMDEEICRRFAGLTIAAAQGLLDGWAASARGRLALLIALDQFPRSLWRDTPGAYAQDCKANLLVLEGIRNGHFQAIKPWEKMFYAIALGHCEGPDHLERLDLMDTISEILISELPPHLNTSAERIRSQNKKGRAVIERFGRHPHRNPIYGRISSPEEEAYIASGDFPHLSGRVPPP
jgi:uncharacterized protein (DUF924 family)